MERVPQATFTNLYGPTEATIASSYYRVDKPPSDAREAIPIGQACPGEELLILDDELSPVPLGEIGHLYIGGVGLSPGYWQDDAKTREAFQPDPRPGREGRIYRTGDLARFGPDGLVYFLGPAGLTGEDPWPSSRAGRDRGGTRRSRGPEGVRRRRGSERRLRRHVDLLCVRTTEGRGRRRLDAEGIPPRSPAELHAADALARAGITSEESKRQARPAAHRATSFERASLPESVFIPNRSTLDR